MKILMITGSPHRNGTTAVLAREFVRGALEAGHEVTRFDAAFKKVHPCMACEHCHNTDAGCVFDDDMRREAIPALLTADAVVFVTPIYYYGMNAQIRTAIDRFYAVDSALHGGKKAVLMVTMADDTDESAAGAVATFHGMTNFLGWQEHGMVIGVDCADVQALQRHDYADRAYQLGRTI